MLGEGKQIPDAAKELGISEATFHRWRNPYGGVKARTSAGRPQASPSAAPWAARLRTSGMPTDRSSLQELERGVGVLARRENRWLSTSGSPLRRG